MTNLYAWAKRHNIRHAALHELMTEFGITASGTSELSESAVQTNIRLEASRLGIKLWRNNVGAGKVLADNGTESFIRWGLANESKQMNKLVKSGDLIGIRPVTITQAHVGTVIGQFVSREAKHGAWSYSGTDREVAQLAWISLVNAMGGDAAFANGEGTL